MFNIGDYVICGSNGVCKVEKIGTLDVSGISKDRAYYTMDKVYSKGSKVYIPVDNDKVTVRPVLSKEEAYSLIDQMENVEPLIIVDERKKSDIFKKSMQMYDCNELLRILKTLYFSKQKKLAEGKKETAGDSNYYRMAEDSLVGELAISLDMDRENVRQMIMEKVNLLYS